MIRDFSIKKGLLFISGLQIFLSLVFLLYSLSLTTYQNYNDTSNRYYQVGEQMLVRSENMISSLEQATLFPSQLYTQNNDSYLCRTLREGPILKNFRFYSYFDTNAKTKFINDAMDFIAIYDLYGNGVASFKDTTYRLCFLDNSPPWYQKLSLYKIGTPLLISSGDFYGSGMFDKDNQSICVARGILDINTIHIVGYCVAGLNTGLLEQTFNQVRLAPNQKFALYKDGVRLAGTIEETFQLSSAALPQSLASPSQYRHLQFDHGKYYVYNTINHSNGYSLLLQTPMSDILGTISRIQIFYTLFVSVLLFLIIGMIFYIVKRILNALNRLIEACNRFELEHATVVSCANLPMELQTLFTSFNHMSERITFLVHEVLMKQQEQQETELQLLRTQINPHYLYNTLEIMHMKAYSHGDYDVSTMAELLGQNLQYGLRNTTKEVLLKEELHQMDIYLSILSYQYKDRIRTNICIEQDLMDCHIIKLVFQPIIENAVIHGIVSKDQILMIDILGYLENDGIVIQISDDGCGMRPDQLEELKNNIESTSNNGIGLRNVCRRIQLNYGPEYKVKIESKYGFGTTVTLRLPWKPQNKEGYRELSDITG